MKMCHDIEEVKSSKRKIGNISTLITGETLGNPC